MVQAFPAHRVWVSHNVSYAYPLTQKFFPQELPQIHENLPSPKNLCKNVYSSLIDNCQKLETAKCSPTGEPTDQVGDVHTVEFGSAIKRNGLWLHATSWMNLKCIKLSERSQSRKAIYCMSLFMWPFGKDKTLEMDNRPLVARDQGYRCAYERIT